jgi:hypothetical protein
MFNWLLGWLGLNPKLPRFWEIQNPMHGLEARNKRGQKVIYDEKQGGKWVMPQNYSDQKSLEIKHNKV